MNVLHEFFHAVALCSAAGNGGDFGPKPALFSLMHDNLDLHRRLIHSAACALISPDTCRIARASCSAGCAPDTAYFCANTKVGTPEMPLSAASLACVEIRSTSSSVARRLRISSASSPMSAAACTSTSVSVRSPPSLKYNSISRCFISADLLCASAQ